MMHLGQVRKTGSSNAVSSGSVLVLCVQLELKEMVERADENGDGVIDQKEFLALMRLKHAE